MTKAASNSGWNVTALGATPSAESIASQQIVHGITLVDDFAWLRDPKWQEVFRDTSVLQPRIRTYLEAENAYTEKAFAPYEPLKKKLIAEMRGRIKEDDSSVPSRDGPYEYFSRYREGGQHPLVCRKPSGGGAEEVMLDGDALAKDKSYFSLGGVSHSPDHKLLAWGYDDKGSELYSLRVRDLSSHADRDDLVTDTGGAALWLADASGFYYIKLDAEHRPSRVYLHRLGQKQADDELIYEEFDKGFFVHLGELQAGRYGAISAGDHDTSEVYLLDLHNPSAKPRLIEPRTVGMRYEVEHHPSFNGEDILVLLTNADGAEDFKIVTTPLANPGRANWRDLIAHSAGTLILDCSVFQAWMTRLERHEGLPRIIVREIATGAEHSIAFEEEAYSLGSSTGYEFVTDTLRFNYSSMTTPTEVWDYDLRTRERVLRKRQEVPSGHNPADYVTRRIFAKAKDGAVVPISLIHHVSTKIDGTAPCLLYGYGSYGISMPASFSTSRLSLVDRGFVYAIAHIRGGTDKGWRWYLDGKMEKKENTFTDFIACGDHLVAEKFASPSRIVAHGGSAGGLLMGAVANLRPDLFAGIIAEVPFVDVINTMLDGTLPLTPPEWPEWGNPATDKAVLERMLRYSPYDNVAAKAYPAMLVLAGLTDPRVTYWEPAKWTAKLRRFNTGENPIFLKTNMDAGHGGAAGRFDRLDEVAIAYVFAIVTAGADASA
ncbi:MAG TPA: S9 family peptidase [Xanthobacteraceae bacterium]|nr:S9 family peptidase [Xanthobacteraceae bacterium]